MVFERYAPGMAGVGVLCIAVVLYHVAVNELQAYDIAVAGVGVGFLLAGIGTYLEAKPSRTK